MSSAAAFTAISTFLNANWNTTPLVYENDQYELPNNPAAFVFVEIWGDQGGFDQASIGAGSRDANLWREYGQLDMHVMVKKGTGSATARGYCDTLVGLFRGLDLGTLTFLDASIGSGEQGHPFKSYWAMTASISWRRDQ